MSRISGFLSTAKDLFENVSQKFTAPVRNEQSKFSLPNDTWKNNLAERTNFSPDESPKTSGDKKFWTEKSPDAKVMRDRLLRDNFHYDSQDIEAFKKKADDSFIIGDSGKCSAAKDKGLPCEWAKPKDINKWEKSGNSVAITLPAAKIKDLQDFRQTRVIDKAVAEISDPALRENVRKDLLQAATGNGQDRINAAQRLLNLDTPNQADLDKARQAVKAIADQPENRNNSMTMLVSGKVKLDEISAKLKDAAQKAGPVDSKINQSVSREIFDAEYQIEKAAKAASGVDNLTGKVDVSKTNRQEAVWVNQQAAVVLRQTGHEKAADYREQMGRFFESDDTERRTAAFSRIIERWHGAPPPDSMRRSTAEEIKKANTPEIETPAKMRNFKEEPNKREWRVKDFRTSDGKLISDGDGGAVKTGYSRFNIKGSLKEVGTDLLTTPVYRDKSGREVNPNKGGYYLKGQESIRLTYEGPELNTGGPARAAAVGGGVAMIGQWNEGTKFLADLRDNTTRNKIDLRDKMEKADFDATHYRVPPEPEKLPKEREKLVRMYGTSKEAEVKINQMMNALEEQSHAFWNW